MQKGRETYLQKGRETHMLKGKETHMLKGKETDTAGRGHSKTHIQRDID